MKKLFIILFFCSPFFQIVESQETKSKMKLTQNHQKIGKKHGVSMPSKQTFPWGYGQQNSENPSVHGGLMVFLHT